MESKKASLELSLETAIGIILAAMALIAIFMLISSLFGIFTNKEEELGAQHGLYEIAAYVDTSRFGEPEKKVPVMLKGEFAIVAFNKNQAALEGKCAKPSAPRDYDNLLITRDPIKCPRESSCLCLCNAEKMDSVISRTFSERYELVDCYDEAICVIFNDEAATATSAQRTAPAFGRSPNCDFPFIYGDGVANVVVAKDQFGSVTLKKAD